MLAFDSSAWEDYLYFKNNDKIISKKIDKLIKDTIREPFDGIGKPEKLKNNLSGYWSRRITKEHRLVYKYENQTLFIVSCRFHYKWFIVNKWSTSFSSDINRKHPNSYKLTRSLFIFVIYFIK